MGSQDRIQGPRVGERRAHRRYEAGSISVGYASTEAFFFTHPDNVSEMGVFIPTRQPLKTGAPLRLRFETGDGETFDLAGRVAWSSEPEKTGCGMGVEFVKLTAEERARLKALVVQVASLPRDEGD